MISSYFLPLSLLVFPILLLPLSTADPTPVIESAPPKPTSPGGVPRPFHSGPSPSPRNRPPPEENSSSVSRTGERDTGSASGALPICAQISQLDPSAATPEGLNAVSPRPLRSQRPSLEGRSPTHVAGNVAAGVSQAGGGRGIHPPPHIATSATGGDKTNGSPPRGPAAAAGGGSGPSAPLLERVGGGEFARDRENKVRQGSPVPLPKGMTGELMRQVAALDVTRMSCEQVRLSCSQLYVEKSWNSPYVVLFECTLEEGKRRSEFRWDVVTEDHRSGRHSYVLRSSRTDEEDSSHYLVLVTEKWPVCVSTKSKDSEVPGHFPPFVARWDKLAYHPFPNCLMHW